MQGTLVPKLTLDPFLTLSVIEWGTNWKMRFLGSHSQSKSRVKVDIETITNILLSLTKTTIPNLKKNSKITIIIGVFFYIKTLHCFQVNVRFLIFEHILNLNHCPVFETNPTFPFLSIIHFSEQSLLA